MRIVRDEIIVEAGNFSLSREYDMIHGQIIESISKVVWPIGSDNFVINPTSHANGVLPIKEACMEHLVSEGWRREIPLNLGATMTRPGKIDAIFEVLHSHYAVEWETGNISSSHRAVNKMILGILGGALIGGTLIIPTRRMYRYLTDRIGSYEELRPYFPMWRKVNIIDGLIGVIAIEQDDTDINVPPIGKGTDGRSLR
ncbi:MAG: restriction endonuclease [Chloroflexi bacterium]|nr:restriction endonuclease [Chloroflexota bacterium]